MKIIYDGALIDETRFSLESNDRAFQYGDGLFETIIYKQGELKFFDRHMNRLLEGMKCLKFKYSVSIKETLEEAAYNLVKQNDYSTARVRIQVWRKSGGLYTPVDNSIHYLIRTAECTDKSHTIDQVGFSNTVVLHYSKFSRFKTCNSLPYILAAVERDKRNLGDLIICDVNGFISEGTSSNIFWKKGDAYFTPDLETGCIDGIMRSVIIDKLVQSGRKISTVKAKKSALEKADQLFFCNVSGISPIRSVSGISYDTFLEELVLDCIK